MKSVYHKSLITITLIILLMYALTPGFSQENKKQPAATDFTLTDIHGNTFNLFNELTLGKTVVLDFFSTSCGSCATTIPLLNVIWQNNSDIWVWGIEVNGVSNAVIDTFEHRNGGSFPCFSTSQNDSVVPAYDVQYTPRFYVVCPDKRRIPSSIGDVQMNIEQCRQITHTELPEQKQQTTLFYTNNDFLFIEILEESGGVFELFNASGRLLRKEFFTSNSQMKIAKQNLSSGVYFYRFFNNENKLFSGKFIIL